MAAIDCTMRLLDGGDHVIAGENMYGGSFRLFDKVLRRFGLEFTYVDTSNVDAVRAAIRPTTKMLYLETPTNPMMTITDIAASVEAVKGRGILTVVDNTFMSPYFQRPLAFGIDVVLHSTTKYINGHSDVVGGALVVKDAQLAEKIGFLQNAMGTCAGPQDCFLVLRGIKTLALRMEEHNRNALEVARWLERHPKVSAVLHPGLPSHPQHQLALRQMRGFGGTFSFRLRAGESAVFRLLERVRVFTLAESLGGVESLIEHPVTMTHVSVARDVLDGMGITPDLVRISVGIEDVQDLIADLESALA
jgi:cystathionine gamma-lyase